MRWDAVMVRVLARELDAKLGGARARAVLLDREGSAVLLCLRDATLVFRLVQPGPSVALSPAQEPPPGALPLPAKIVHVDSIADERILRIHFHRVRGRAEDPALIVEFGPRRPNAVLVGRTSGKVQAILKPTRVA
jgi:predicted ribosome quality control (RQC) complex YloA/Tae2 family protein